MGCLAGFRCICALPARPTPDRRGSAAPHDINSHTILTIEKLQYNLPLQDEAFTLQALRREL
jgi:hypothetical protein